MRAELAPFNSHHRDLGRYAVRVHWLRRYLASLTVTPIGIVVLVVLAVAFGLFAFGPSAAQVPALILGLILLIGMGWRGSRSASTEAAGAMRI